MRKVVVLVGLLLLLQLVWISPSQAASPAAEGFWHTVQPGQTLFSIGRQYGVNPYAICQANGLYNCNWIWAGQRLWIPYGGPPQPYCSTYHIVQRGQTVYSLSRYYGVAPWAIAQANHLHNINYIYVGQKLCIP
jgi:spore germination protein